jgi:hypothetical protein
MKIRNGFVSNSSSSSFIISSKEKPEMVMKIDVSKISEYEVHNKKELDRYFEENNDYYDSLEDYLEDDYNKEQYRELLNELKEGNTIYIGDVCSDDDNDNSSYIYCHGFDGDINFKVISNP